MRLCLGTSCRATMGERAFVAAELPSARRLFDSENRRTLNASARSGIAPEGASKAKLNSVVLGVDNPLHGIKIVDLIIFLSAVDVVDVKPLRNRSAMRFPNPPMEIDGTLRDDIPCDVIAEPVLPPPLTAPRHG